MPAETKYARNGDIHLAYQVTGNGPLDLVFVPGFVSHLEFEWEEPSRVRFFDRLAAFCRVIRFDKRGTGMSDRTAGVATLEERMDDVRAVMDAVSSERATLVGASEGGPMSLLFAATYPERISALVLYGTYARRTTGPDYPWGRTLDEWEAMLETVERDWGRPVAVDVWAPSMVHDEAFNRWWATYLRLAASPGAALATLRMTIDIDVRHLLPAVRVPTLILHRIGDRITRVEQARYLAERIPDAKLIEMSGDDHVLWVGDADGILDEIEEFLTGARHLAESDRVLVTVLFTDVVDSTSRAVELGDRRWRDLLGSHHQLVRRELARFRGHEVKTVGDGFLASFDGPARAIRCARAISDGVRQLGLEVRAGLHTGEVEIIGDDVGGIAVHIGARVAAEAAPGEVLVSSTVRDLVAGSGIKFEDRGTRALKGVPGEWRLFAVDRAASP